MWRALSRLPAGPSLQIHCGLLQSRIAHLRSSRFPVSHSKLPHDVARCVCAPHTSDRRSPGSLPQVAAASLTLNYWLEELSTSPPVVFIENTLVSLHDLSGLPWWATVVTGTVITRVVLTAPLAVYQNYIINKVERLRPEIADLGQLHWREVQQDRQLRGWSEKKARAQHKARMKQSISGLYVRDNCHPAKASLLAWVQIPLWLIITVALRTVCISEKTADQPRGLAEGGLLWISDLTVPDPFWILPLMLGATNLLIVEMFSRQRKHGGLIARLATYFMRGVSIFMVFVAGSVPSALSLYWVTSSIWSLLQNLVLRSSRLRAVMRLSPIRSRSLSK
uniref:cytochrome c oxidase assembly protein COX18, mitochondrial isoform X1 n=2 Tax=Myxine glutinosa TaxID=7769 RepID=UPI00358E3683